MGMSSAKKDKGSSVSRRDFLFGAVKRLKLEHLDAEEEKPKAPKSNTETAEFLREAYTAYAAGDFEKAAAAYRKCIKIDAGDIESRRRLGYCLYRMGKYVQAGVEFERVLYSQKKDNFAFLYLGLAMARLGKKEKAVNAWQGYFNTAEIIIQREINLQLALMEQPEHPELEQIADEIEAVVDERRRELSGDKS
jgi:tetratricopeptide (TPR) repeat protein